MALPSQASYKRLQQNPGLLKGDHGLLEEFEAAPWLLPARTPQLPYANLHSFEKLLALRSRPVGSLKKSITLLLFSKAWAVMAQNSSEWSAQQLLPWSATCSCQQFRFGSSACFPLAPPIQPSWQSTRWSSTAA